MNSETLINNVDDREFVELSASMHLPANDIPLSTINMFHT